MAHRTARALAPFGRALAPFGRAVALRAAAGATNATLVVRDSDRVHHLGSGSPVGEVTMNDARAYLGVLGAGSVGLGRSYVDGWWDSADLTAVVRALYRWTAGQRDALDRLAVAGVPWLGPGRRHARVERGANRSDISAHYDLSNEFFELMLDPTMSYSCAVFPFPGPPRHAGQASARLEQAQLTKLDLICTKLELSERDHLVEIGTGWGGLAIHAASSYGCRVTTTTISQAQREYATKRVADAGLSHLVTVVGEDWRDMEGTYDKLVSVEMVEAVDWRLYRRLMERFSGLLREGGLGLVQAIVIEDGSFHRAKKHKDFVREMVFPGSCIPSVAALVAALAAGSGLRLVGLEDIGENYAPTLAAWAQNLRANKDGVEALGIPSRTQRLWALYLAYCEASFLEGHISDVQMLLSKPDPLCRRGPL